MVCYYLTKINLNSLGLQQFIVLFFIKAQQDSLSVKFYYRTLNGTMVFKQNRDSCFLVYDAALLILG